ncbi:HlyD family secretion protein [Pseudochrobactrum asaccharolyticum]|uniref:Membrane fusion protein (Multidrug efflux system) n=1 Tax=Pseudochrobactrum asaccharolyticum TaxID=354351 RepID=A0A366DTE9_9HYPH|nr:membrane fusion protein (multidrug efflux system) [Pseudochrobactrum asaccharolyticum]
MSALKPVAKPNQSNQSSSVSEDQYDNVQSAAPADLKRAAQNDDNPASDGMPYSEQAQPQPAQTAAPAAVKPLPAKPSRKRKVLSVVLLAVLAGGAWYGYDWWTTGRFMVSTDDAYIHGDIMAMSPKVTGYIDDVLVSANSHVKAGDPIFQLDQGDYQIALNEKEAALETQQKTLARIEAQTVAAEAALTQARASQQSSAAVLINAQATMERITKLHDTRFVSQSELDRATTSLAQAKASDANAAAQIAAAEANIGVLKAQYQEAESQTRSLELARDKAQRDLSFTTLRAPFDGVIGNLTGKKGDLVSAGQRIAALVPVNALYIDANFKETQLKKLQDGQVVHFTVDALGGEKFEGKLASLSPASGSVFSLLPPENATGNFTKVVQRVPVRIAIPEAALATGKLRAGLSVVVDVDIRTASSKSDAAE